MLCVCVCVCVGFSRLPDFSQINERQFSGGVFFSPLPFLLLLGSVKWKIGNQNDEESNKSKEREKERERQKKRKAFLVRSVASGSITLTNGVNLSHRPLWKWNDFSGKHFNMYVCTLRYENWEEPERDWKWFLIRIARDEFHWQTSGSHVTERKWWRHRPSSRQLGGGFFSRSPRLTRHELLCKSTPPPSAPLCPSPFPLRSGFHYPIKMRLELTLQQSTRLSHNKSNKQMVNQHHDVLPSPLPPLPLLLAFTSTFQCKSVVVIHENHIQINWIISNQWNGADVNRNRSERATRSWRWIGREIPARRDHIKKHSNKSTDGGVRAAEFRLMFDPIRL